MQTCEGSEAVLSRCIGASKLMPADDLYGVGTRTRMVVLPPFDRTPGHLT